jgi:Domain of unknown function (DUF4145)
MPNTWVCPFCRQKANPNRDTARVEYGDKQSAIIQRIDCPNPDCKYMTLRAMVRARKVVDGRWTDAQVLDEWPLIPVSRSIPIAEYVPVQVRSDYEEACQIESLSPKASAALSRRCVQGIIRDFYGLSRPRLVDEIDELEGKVEDAVLEALHALRSIGNIGAHPERDPTVIVDIEPGEATAMIDLVELLIKETYVARKRREDTLSRVSEISKAKEAARRKTVR